MIEIFNDIGGCQDKCRIGAETRSQTQKAGHKDSHVMPVTFPDHVWPTKAKVTFRARGNIPRSYLGKPCPIKQGNVYSIYLVGSISAWRGYRR